MAGTYVLRDIERAVCQHFGLTAAQMRSPARQRAIARPRRMVMFLARELTAASYPKIGRYLGGRDHTTVLYGTRKIARLMRETNHIPYELEGVRAILAGARTVKAAARHSIATVPLVQHMGA